MRSLLVIALSPLLDLVACVLQAREPLLVEALVSERAVEAFDEAVLDRLPRLDEVELDVSLFGPGRQRDAQELRSVVRHQSARKPKGFRELIEHSHHPIGRDGRRDLDPRHLSRAEIHDRERPQPAPIDEPVVDEVHRPGVVSLDRDGSRGARKALQPLAPSATYLELKGAIHAIDPLAVRRRAFAPQQAM